jgi:hypothetical protein
MRWRVWTSSSVTGPRRPASPAIGRHRRARPAPAPQPAAGSSGPWADSFWCSTPRCRSPKRRTAWAIVGTDPRTGGYTQHYYDSRGVARLYAMSFADGVWTLTRESPDFSPLDFRQRFTGTFSEDGNTITGAWEKSPGGDWEHDFALTYRRAG